MVRDEACANVDQLRLYMFVLLRYWVYDCFFFFSSRRRHTRCLSDWSSDVCSSDLGVHLRMAVGNRPHERNAAARTVAFVLGLHVGRARRQAHAAVHALLQDGVVELLRSEERRVGKESRSQWSP